MEAVKRARDGARLPKCVTPLARLGEEIERRWSGRDYRLQFFHHIAADCLRASAYHRQFDEDAITAWVNRASSLPRQLDSGSAESAVRKTALKSLGGVGRGN
jgi:hypothetical protein